MTSLAILLAADALAKLGATVAMARQPEMQSKLQSSMIVAAALVEGATFFTLIISILALFV